MIVMEPARVIIVGNPPSELITYLEEVGITYSVIGNVAESLALSINDLADSLGKVIIQNSVPKKQMTAKMYGESLQKRKTRFRV
jgi:hypothetical protein